MNSGKVGLMPDNLDFVIEQLAEACRDGWTYGYIGDDGKAHNSFGDALSHLRNYRASIRTTSDRTELDRLKAQNAELHAAIRALLDHLERLAASMEQPEFARVRFLVDKYRRDR